MSSHLTFGQKEVPFYEPHQLNLNTETLKSNRVELKESSMIDGKERLDAYVYMTIDHIQSFGEKQLMLNWTALTSFGTGIDLNLVSAKDLSLYGRITPRGVPFGFFIESRAFDKEANIISVNPDYSFHDELKGLSSSQKSVDKKPNVKLPYETYNAIIWPYVFASLDLKVGQSMVLPDYSPYQKELAYYRINVLTTKKSRMPMVKNIKYLW